MGEDGDVQEEVKEKAAAEKGPRSLVGKKDTKKDAFMAAVDEDYFGSYSHFVIHREMISDKVHSRIIIKIIIIIIIKKLPHVPVN
jgi:hypothetical protein